MNGARLSHKGIGRFSGMPNAQRGASLIEVLVAVIIMSIGLLGVAAMQSVTLRNSQGSMERTQAVIQSYTILDAMRANLAAARGGAYDINSCTVPAAGATLVQADQRAWIQSLKATLGDSDAVCGTVACAADDVCTITVTWDDTRASGGVDDYSITTTSRL